MLEGKSFNKLILVFFILLSYSYFVVTFVEAGRSFKVVLSKKKEGYPERFQGKLEHPYNISKSILHKIMQNLYYIEKKGGRGWKKEKRVFSNFFVDKASVLIKTALNKAGPDQKVVLRQTGSKGEIICDIFIKEEVLNFKFDKINGISKIHNKWKMVPRLSQRYYIPPKTNLAFDILKGGRYKDFSWIRVSLLDFAEDYQVKITPQSTDKPLITANNKEKTLPFQNQKIKPLSKLEKIKSLKEAFDNKLINIREYQNKAIKILKSPAEVKMNLKDELFFLSLLKREGFISEEYYNEKKKTLLENL